MSALGIAGITIGAGALLSFWGWLAVTVVKTSAKVADLQARMDSQQVECGARLESINSLFGKVNAVATDVAFIRGKMENVT